MSYSLWRHPGTWAPLVMSLMALALVVGHLALFGTAREADEGAAAHLFQLLIVGQIPFIAFFAIRWLHRMRRAALKVMALQVVAIAAACAPVWFFHL